MLKINQQARQWMKSDYAAQILSVEAHYIKNALRQISGPRVLQIGHLISPVLQQQLDFPELIVTQQVDSLLGEADVIADSAFLPFASESISSVILPHMLEQHNLPHQILREVDRILQPEGYFVLTAFNPTSFLGLQRYLRPKSALQGCYFSPRRVIDWLQLLSFEVVGSAMFQYAPLTRKIQLQKSLSFLNSIGDRWLPMLGGGYIIIAKKRNYGMTMVGKVIDKKTRKQLKRRTLASPSPAKTRAI